MCNISAKKLSKGGNGKIADIILDVKDLKTYFYVNEGELRAVDSFSYQVEKGQCVAIVGESGCGKSVSAFSIMRLIPYPPGIIVGGEIIFDGRDLLKLSEKEMQTIRGNRIAMVFQEPMTSLNPVLTIKQQLIESFSIHQPETSESQAVQEAIKLLKEVRIPDAERRINDYPHQFSGGMQQRIMIAMALICKPALLIADEPTTAVDVTVQAQLLELINSMRKQLNTAVILITHNLGIVARYADKVEVMYAGRLVEGGPTDTIFEEPGHPYTMGLIASVPRLDLERHEGLHTIEGNPPNLIHLPRNMCAFSPRCEYAQDMCKQARPQLEEISPGHFVACFRRRDMQTLKEGFK